MLKHGEEHHLFEDWQAGVPAANGEKNSLIRAWDRSGETSGPGWPGVHSV